MRLRSEEFALTTDVRGVAEDGHVWQTTAQFDWDVPLRHVAIEVFAVCAESAMDCANAGYSGIVETLHCSNPEFQVGVDRVFDEHGHVDAFERIGDFLHSERICRGSSANPEHIDAVLEGCLNVLARSHFGSDEHTGLFLHAFEPYETFFADTFEAPRLGARFPDACSEVLYPCFSQIGCRRHYLFFCLGTARTCYDYRSLVVDSFKLYRFNGFHIYIVCFILVNASSIFSSVAQSEILINRSPLLPKMNPGVINTRAL